MCRMKYSLILESATEFQSRFIDTRKGHRSLLVKPFATVAIPRPWIRSLAYHKGITALSLINLSPEFHPELQIFIGTC